MRPNGAPGPVLRPLGGPRRGLSGIIRQFLEVEFSEVQVASDPSSAVPSTLQRHGATLSASKHGDQVAFVSAFCIKTLRLVTPQLPEKLADVEGRISGILGLPNADTSTHPGEVGR